MNDRLLGWWRTRTVREQRLLLAMVALLAVVLVWLLIVRPLNDALSAARERHGEAVVALAEAKAAAEAIKRLQSARPARLTAPLDTLLSASAGDAGFAVSRVEGSGPSRATVTIAAARPQALFGWVEQMERRHGLIVEGLQATTNSDQSLAVEISFRARGG
jgi:general secretion pathway protein M